MYRGVLSFALLLAALMGAAACGSSGAPQRPHEVVDGAEADDESAPERDDEAPPPRAGGKPDESPREEDQDEPKAPEKARDAGGTVDENGCKTFTSSYEAIQKIIFEGRGCTARACHGDAKAGDLDLRADVSWENLVDARSANSSYARVQPGTALDSYLYQKLIAAVDPGRVQIAGSPMPVGTEPLTQRELEAIQLWILKGAPKTGTVADQTKAIDVGSLLDACLPPAKPVKTKPLEPPAPDEGVQIVLPSYLLKAGSEVDHCTPFVFDVSAQVPAQYKDPARNVMFVNGSRVRQDPQSHHLVLMNPAKDLTTIAENAPGWTCRGGSENGKACNPRKVGADCGGGICASPTKQGPICSIDTDALAAGQISLDTIASALDVLITGGVPTQIANTQSPQQYTPPLDGVYQELPMRGILWFNSHAFNLTDEDTVLDARVNYYFAKERRREIRPVNVVDNISIANGQAPFTRKTYCAKAVVPQNYSIPMMTGHTHRRGEHFWVTDPGGKKIYESFDYNDPEYRHYTPWLEFPSADAAQRTLEYCATYNNGLKKDGSPDLELVTRKSRMPARTTCTPVACTKGKVTSACKTDRECDSAPGANDGECDACPITAGQTTENEMFVMMPWYVLPAKQ